MGYCPIHSATASIFGEPKASSRPDTIRTGMAFEAGSWIARRGDRSHRAPCTRCDTERWFRPAGRGPGLRNLPVPDICRLDDVGQSDRYEDSAVAASDRDAFASASSTTVSQACTGRPRSSRSKANMLMEENVPGIRRYRASAGRAALPNRERRPCAPLGGRDHSGRSKRPSGALRPSVNFVIQSS